MRPLTAQEFHLAVAAHGELGKALDTAVFAAPEETSWRARAFGAIFELIENLGMRVFLDEEFDILDSTLLTVETGLMLSSDPDALIEAIRLRALRDKIGAMRT